MLENIWNITSDEYSNSTLYTQECIIYKMSKRKAIITSRNYFVTTWDI